MHSADETRACKYTRIIFPTASRTTSLLALFFLCFIQYVWFRLYKVKHEGTEAAYVSNELRKTETSVGLTKMVYIVIGQLIPCLYYDVLSAA